MGKKFLALILVSVFLATALAGCGTGSNTNPAPTTQVNNVENTKVATSVVVDTPVKDTLVVAIPADPPSLDPVNAGGAGCMRVLKQIYENLTTIGADGNPAPGLAESWDISDDGITYVFHLKQGVLFHNGEELKADDIVFTVERGKTSSYIGSIWSPVDHAEVVDDYTVKVVLKYPYSPFLNAMAGPGGAAITNRKAVTDAGETYDQHGIGTGPYQVVEWITGDKVVLIANENWHDGKVPIKKLTFKIIPDNSTAAIALEKGEVDAMVEINDIDKVSIKKNPKLGLYETPSFKVSYIGFNNENPKFSNKLVRQAISYAIDKEGALLAAREGFGTVAQNFLVDGLFGFDPNIKAPDMNIETAKALMAEAGVADGFSVTIMTKDGADKKLAQVVQENLSKINITAELQVLETSSFTATAKNGDYEMMVNTWSSPVPDADYSLYFLMHSVNIGGMNFVRVNNPTIDELLNTGRTVSDPVKRQAAYSELLKVLIDVVPSIPVYFELSSIATDANLQGVIPVPTTEYRYVNFNWK